MLRTKYYGQSLRDTTILAEKLGRKAFVWKVLNVRFKPQKLITETLIRMNVWYRTTGIVIELICCAAHNYGQPIFKSNMEHLRKILSFKMTHFCLSRKAMLLPELIVYTCVKFEKQKLSLGFSLKKWQFMPRSETNWNWIEF